jgi:ATP-dependent Clp protease ATP-binding subunit ClpC
MVKINTLSLCLSALLLCVVYHAPVSGFSLGSESRALSISSPLISRGSFVSNSFSNRRQLSANNNRKNAALSLTMVMDRLSNECVQAVKQSHDIGNEIGLTSLPTEILFAGIVKKPERAASTLDKFGITFEEVKTVAARNVQYKPGVGSDGSTSKKDALPFSEDTKLTLDKACEIADRMESPTVRSEHVLLALMGYNNGNKIETVPVIGVLKDMPTLRRADVAFSVTKFCDELINALPFTPISGEGLIVRDKVVIGGQSGTTNTLSEVGVDLTQMALEGKIDMVFGRDDEIRAALRTLGRRRKNNPCLIGDPGVGKTAVAEAIAQVLANGMLELQEIVEKDKPQTKIQERFSALMKGRGKDGPSANNGEEGAVEYKLPPCPKSLLGARLINVELAGLVAGTSNRGDFEKRLKSLIKEASENNVILFIDEIHNLIGTGGGGDGAMNDANLLKPALAHGELRVLGATMTTE